MSRRKVCPCLLIGATLASSILIGGAASAEEVLREISWSQLSKEGLLSVGEVLAPEPQTGFERLKIAVADEGPSTLTVLVLEPPGITASRYAIQGQVRYEGVEGQGYLEMWSTFPDGGSYFSRTLSDSGPMKHLKGSSDWRAFVLPFFINEGTKRPVKLLVNVVLPGKGTVMLSPVKLIQYGSNEDPLSQSGQWWSDRTAGLVGGIAGTLLGCLGGLIGWLGSKGRARGFVLGAMKSMRALGIALVAGGVLVARVQPYAVYYPLLLIGLILLAVSFYTLPNLRKRYEEIELRKMRAMDVT